MKIAKSLLIIFLISIFTIGAVSASDNITSESISVEDSYDGEMNLEIQDTDIEEDLNEESDSQDIKEPKDAEIDLYVPKEVMKTETMTISYNTLHADNVQGKVDIYIDNELNRETIVYDQEEGYMALDIDNKTIGTHTCNIVYSGNDYNKPFNRTFEFEIVNVHIYVDEVMYKSNDIKAVLPADATGTVTININGSSRQYNVKDAEDDYNENKVISQELSNLEYGTYDVEVTYSGNYGKITKRMNMTLDMHLSFYTRFAGLAYYTKHYNDKFLFFYAPSNVTVLIDGRDIHYDKTHNKPGSISRSENEYDGEIFSQAPIWFTEVSLSQGWHNIELIATENGYTSSIKDVFYLKESRLADKKSQLVNQAYPIELLFDENATGHVSFYMKVNDGNYTLIDCANITDSVAKTIINCSESGKYQIKAVLNTDEYNEEISTEFNVVPAILEYKHWFERWQGLNEASTDTFTLQAGENVTGTFSLFINNKLYKKVNINAKSAKITLPGTAFNKKCGDYNLKATWNTNYGNGSEHIEPIFVTDFTSIDYCYENGYNKNIPSDGAIVMYYNNKISYSVNVINEKSKSVGKGKTVIFQIGKQTIKVKTNSKGIATLKIPNTIKPGKYTIKASYKGLAKTVTCNKKLTVKQILTLKTVKVKKSAKKLVLTATLKKGKTPLKKTKVTFKFKGKTYKATTNNKGIAKVTIKKSVLKKLKVGKKVTYQVTYLKDTVKKTAKVKR